MTVGEARLPQGLIVKGIGGLYYARGEADGLCYVLRAKGKFRKQGLSPMVGDHILLSPGQGEEHGWIEEILPRKNAMIRPPVANISTLLLVVAPVPAPDMLLLDTLLVMASQQEIQPVLVVNKCDLDSTLGIRLQEEYAGLDAPVLEVSAKTGQGMEALQQVLRQGLCCFAGQSGVGKSTLLSQATGLRLETGEISRKTARGKHTTRHAEILYRDGYTLLDTPGFSQLDPWTGMEPIQLQNHYPELYALEGQCRFHPCYHRQEPGCAVLAAVNAGRISPERMERYHQLLEKVEKAWRERYE